MRTRALYTDFDEATFAGARPILMEGIVNFITQPDLLNRSIIFALKPLPNRKTERELFAEFDRQKAGILGALCDMLAMGLRNLPQTQVADLPRMADFATWAVACGLDAFEAAYARNRQAATDVVLAHDILAQAVEALIATRREWRGTAQELLNQLGPIVRITAPNVLSDRLVRLTPLLRSHQVSVTQEQRTAKRREITIARIEQNEG